MVFVLVCLLDSFPDANGIKAMATIISMPLKLISDGEASSRPIGPVVNGGRTEAVSRLMISPSRVVAMHFSSASYSIM